MAAAIKFAEDLGTEVIDIFVAPERKRYVVHKSPLTAQSEYFRNAFKGDFKEAHENSIHLKEEDPAAVALMIGFVYRGVIPGTEKKFSPFAQPYCTTSREKPTIPNAELINGSSYPFSNTSLAEENSTLGMRNQFQSICFQPQYSMFSQEELRLADYKVGRKYLDSLVTVARGGIFGNPPGHPVPTGGGLFGTSPFPSLFGPSSYQQYTGAPPSQSTSLFGTPQLVQSQQTQGVSSSSSHPTSLLGTPQPAQSSTTLFGTPQLASSQQTANVSGIGPSPAQPTQAGTPVTSSAPAQPRQTCAFALGSSAAAQTSSASSPPNSVSSGTSVQTQATASTASNTEPDSSGSSTQNGHTTTNTTPAASTQSSTAFAAHTGSGLLPFGLMAPSTSQTGSLFSTPGLSSSQAQPQAPASLFGSIPQQAHHRQPGWPHAAPPTVGSHPTSIFAAPPPGSLFASTWGRGTQNISSPVTSPGDDAPKRPGSFGWTCMIEYPKSPGAFIPGIPRSQPLDAIITENHGQQLALLNLCLLAETILWPSLFNAAIEAYVRGEMNLHRPIPPEHVTLIYDRTHSESTLRAYVLESMCTNRGDSLMYIDLTRQYDELMEDILNKLPELRNTPTAPWVQDDLIRSFHMVDLGMSGKEKEKEDVDISGVFPRDNGEAST